MGSIGPERERERERAKELALPELSDFVRGFAVAFCFVEGLE